MPWTLDFRSSQVSLLGQEFALRVVHRLDWQVTDIQLMPAVRTRQNFLDQISRIDPTRKNNSAY